MKTCVYLTFATIAASLLPLTGCSTSTADGTTPDVSATAEEVVIAENVELDFAPPEIEGHSHEIGPNGGHVVLMQPGDLKAEWVQLTEDETVQVFLPSAKDANRVTMLVSLDAGPSQTFDLKRDEALGTEGYSIKSPELMTAIKMKDAVKVNLEVEAGEQTLKAAIEHIGCSCGNH